LTLIITLSCALKSHFLTYNNHRIIFNQWEKRVIIVCSLYFNFFYTMQPNGFVAGPPLTQEEFNTPITTLTRGIKKSYDKYTFHSLATTYLKFYRWYSRTSQSSNMHHSGSWLVNRKERHYFVYTHVAQQ